jgi:hypothetical protein
VSRDLHHFLLFPFLLLFVALPRPLCSLPIYALPLIYLRPRVFVSVSRKLSHFIGLCYSLLGQVYYGLSTEGDPLARKETLGMTYEYLTSALKPKYQLKESVDWVVDRLLIASVVMREPSVLSENRDAPPVNPDIAIDVLYHFLCCSHLSFAFSQVALSHLNLALSAPLAKVSSPTSTSTIPPPPTSLSW